MKAIQFNQQQIEAYKNGATMFLFPIEEDIFVHDTTVTFDNKTQCWFVSDYIKEFSPLQKGDKFFVQEDIVKIGKCAGIESLNIPPMDIVTGFTDASQMQEHQARFKDVCLDVEVKRIDDIKTARKIENILGTNFITKSGHIGIEEYSYLIDEFNKNYLKKDNTYVFLITVKGISKEEA